jgi:DNA-binding NtrC family response regulator
MNRSTYNLFIVENNRTMARGLQFFLSRRFGNSLNISVFYSAEDALAKLTARTDIVVLDAELQGESGTETLKAIKRLSPLTEVVILTNNDDVLSAIESFRRGANDIVMKNSGDVWSKVSSVVYKIVTYPIHLLVREFSVNKYIALFLLTFCTMAVVVFFVLKAM